ncbi:MAG: glycosyltransferase family 2 protein [Bacteroidia bacterium]|nr:glycosyltransferase family 2 protein [Bacteroidia bacterium]
MDHQPLISVIILHFRFPEVSEECLNHVLTQDHQAVEVFLVDNASGDDFSGMVAIQDPRVRMISSKTNLGYAGGNNLALKEAKGEFIALINNDVVLPQGWISSMVAAWPESGWGLISSCIVKYGSDGVLQYAGFTPVAPLTGRNNVIGQGKQWEPEDRLLPTAYAHGSAMMASREALALAGPISEQYFLYYEELDWSETIRRAGLNIGVYHGVAALHHGSLSLGKDSPNRWYYYHRGRLIFQRKWLAPSQRMLFLGYYLLLAVPKELITHLLQRKWGHLRAWFDAASWHLRHWRRLPDQSQGR